MLPAIGVGRGRRPIPVLLELGIAKKVPVLAAAAIDDNVEVEGYEFVRALGGIAMKETWAHPSGS